MPAIQPARLKLQAAQLGEKFAQPAAFLRGLHDLLEFYADRTRRPSQTGTPPPLLPTYNVPPPVMRHIERELTPRATASAEAALALADALWGEPHLECRLLAIHLLGAIPPTPLAPILQRALAWAQDTDEDTLLEALLQKGLKQVRENALDRFLTMIQDWLNTNDIATQKVGLLALLTVLTASDFENLPLIFRMLAPVSASPPLDLRLHLLDVIEALAHRSPQETAYFLRQSLTKTNDPGSAWLVRNSLNFFPEPTRGNLRTLLRGE